MPNGPFRRPVTLLAAPSLSRKSQTFPPAPAWVGAECTPGNSPQIEKWRTLGHFVQILRPPYQTAHIVFLATLTLLGWAIFELNTSWLQAHVFHALSAQLTYEVKPGPSPRTVFPSSGPLDERRGYTRLPVILSSLQNKGFVIQAQAQPSPELTAITNLSIPPIYKGKTQSGLHILDGHGQVLFHHEEPNRIFPNFEMIPPILIQTLLFIENRELLDPCCPYANPALEWDRLGQAFLTQGIRWVKSDRSVPGGSTLATQLEKFQHSPGGQTSSFLEKVRQVTAASLRIYQDGPLTQDAQKRLIVDYMNSFPLGAYPRSGEIHGFGDGLWAWYHMDLSMFQKALADSDPASLEKMALAAATYKKGVSLLLALRRPSYYLTHIDALNDKTNTYLRLLTNAGIISPVFRDLALMYPLVFAPPTSTTPGNISFQDQKAPNFIRTHLQKLLGVPSLYALDHLDVTVDTTLDRDLQFQATTLLQQMAKPDFVTDEKLAHPHLLAQGNPKDIVYSLTLYERTPHGNLLRVQTDTLNQPLDINQGSKMDLGSTAKLRTLVTYLEVIEQLHHRYAGLSAQTLLGLNLQSMDPLSKWAVSYLQTSSDQSLSGMLQAALDRRYSASPAERFWTGGGLHTFANFNRTDNEKLFTVREAFQHSVNLVFIRLMRDLVHYHTLAIPGSTAKVLKDPLDPIRHQYLQKFARQEGRIFLHRFFEKYKGLTPEEAWQLVLHQTRLTPLRLAVLLRSIEPDKDVQAFTASLRQAFPTLRLSPEQINRLYAQTGPRALSLADRGYVARIHPLELWTAAFLRQHPNTSKADLAQASEQELVNVYAWLFKTHRKGAQDRRIRLILEQEAFMEIHKSWKRVGYPFATLVPSLATAIGSSADRPAALTELMGILVNEGKRIPTVTIRQLHFAERTPFETLVIPQEPGREQVLSPLVAQILRQELIGVVEQGTAIGAKGAFLSPAGGIAISIGGKTGTGDHRQKVYERGYRLIESRPISRTATFVFLIDNRFFGTITAQVSGPQSGDFRFTSSLPVHIFRLFAPYLHTYVLPQRLEAKGPQQFQSRS
ncbi:MAG TPA: transglycosylase domain-containing protein [Nitrospirales bacterium]|nr:transglycosylase domain-containing protein [Nitrospirales bacterium]